MEPSPRVVMRGAEFVYDRLIAAEKLSSDKKYERLAAVVFRILDERQSVHDLRLRGSSRVLQQIDVVVGDGRDSRRALIECKDYTRKVGLPLIRNFWGAVEDIRPDEAFVVTTVGYTRPAVQFAAAKGIRLALLRPPQDDDWGDLIRTINFELRYPVPLEDPQLNWLIPEDQMQLLSGLALSGHARPADLEVEFADGRIESGETLIHRHVLPPPLDDIRDMKGSVTFEEPARLRLRGWPELRTNGFSWSRRWTVGSHSFSVGDGIGGLTAELVLRTMDGDIHRMFTNRELVEWTLDDHGHVVPREI